MTEKTSETNRKTFPLEIIFSTFSTSNINNNDEFDNEEDGSSSEKSHSLTVEYDGQEYNIILGKEIFKKALNQAFTHLGKDSLIVLKADVELQIVNKKFDSK